MFPVVDVPVCPPILIKEPEAESPSVATVDCKRPRLPTHTVLPLIAVVILEIALLPRLTTLWATICSPPVTTEERVVAD